ncbi:MAG TPA: hypothetical protein EYP56_14970, partial [Planctomycetaceae bacterium]|nr:hypothetical protein [Planctomycetaceae bacterium]
MDDKDPESNQDIHLAYLRRTQGNNMPVALSDILSCDGRYLWMRSQKIDFQGRRLEIGLENVTQQPPEDFHLFCQVGFLDDSYFFRTYWTYGRRVTGGYGGWLRAGRLVPSGRILCFDQTRVFGFGRKPEFMTNASVVQYQIFAADKSVPSEAIERVQKANGAINARSPFRNANSSDWLLRRFFPTRQLTAVNYHWTVQQPSLMVRAMVLTRKLLAVAGPPNFIDERQAYRMPDSPEVLAALKRQQEAMRGRHGGELWLLSKDDGQLVARYALDTIPVFDGMAVAQDRLLLSTVDGRLLCMSGRAPEALEPVRDRPRQIVWDMPEDPSYLLPPEEPKEEDFDRVVRCKVVAAKLGYRLTAKSRDHTALALIKLATPVTTTATFTTRLRAAPVSSGELVDLDLIIDSTTFFQLTDGNDPPQDLTSTRGALLNALNADPNNNTSIEIVLYRRLNPNLPDLDPQFNPWIEADRFELSAPGMREFPLRPNTDANSTPSIATLLDRLRSFERAQALIRDSQDEHQPEDVRANTLGQTNKNSLFDHDHDPTTPDVPRFPVWQPHFDRDFASAAELLAIPLFGPADLTD